MRISIQHPRECGSGSETLLSRSYRPRTGSVSEMIFKFRIKPKYSREFRSAILHAVPRTFNWFVMHIFFSIHGSLYIPELTWSWLLWAPRWMRASSRDTLTTRPWWTCRGAPTPSRYSTPLSRRGTIWRLLSGLSFRYFLLSNVFYLFLFMGPSSFVFLGSRVLMTEKKVYSCKFV